MRQFTAADVTRNSGDVFAMAAAEPIAITKHSKTRFVVMTIEKYNKMIAQADPRRVYAMNEMPDELTDELLASLEADLND